MKRRLSISVSVLLFACIGCQQSNVDLVRVDGFVRRNGVLLQSGTISFRPDPSKQNASRQQPTGIIDETGRYELFTAGEAGAPAGWYKVVVFAHTPVVIDANTGHAALPKSLINTEFNSPKTTPLEIEVVPLQIDGQYDLELP